MISNREVENGFLNQQNWKKLNTQERRLIGPKLNIKRPKSLAKQEPLGQGCMLEGCWNCNFDTYQSRFLSWIINFQRKKKNSLSSIFQAPFITVNMIKSSMEKMRKFKLHYFHSICNCCKMISIWFYDTFLYVWRKPFIQVLDKVFLKLENRQILHHCLTKNKTKKNIANTLLFYFFKVSFKTVIFFEGKKDKK